MFLLAVMVVEETEWEAGEEAKAMVARLAVKKANLHCSSEIPPSVLQTGYIRMGTSW